MRLLARSLSQLSVTMTMPAMQKPATTRIAIHGRGATTSTCTSAVTEISDANAANARMCPTATTAPTAYRAPSSNPRK